MMIYADNAATTRMSPAAIKAMTACMEEQYGNPSSLYTLGQNGEGDPGEGPGEIAAVIHADPGRSTSPPAAARRTIRPSGPRREREKRTERRISSPPPLSITRCCTR